MQMIRLMPRHSCPYCGSQQGYLVKQMKSELYLVNRDGEICDSQEQWSVVVGKCKSCGAEMEMYPAFNSFIPLTPLRKMLLEYELDTLSLTNNKDSVPIMNPFLKERDKNESNVEK